MKTRHGPRMTVAHAKAVGRIERLEDRLRVMSGALRAFAEVANRIPDAYFTIVGDGPERASLEADAKRYNLQGKVDFISRMPQEKLFELYDSHDIFLFPSLHDSGGFVVLAEALAGSIAYQDRWIELLDSERYVHRLSSVDGKPLHYVAMVARKLGPASAREHVEELEAE